jgi:hypothetical protein
MFVFFGKDASSSEEYSLLTPCSPMKFSDDSKGLTASILRIEE